ncbi:DUF4177 domain-containing protein [Rhodobacter sp. SGA-6-6]|uniref:DUF4177 domain-containing protein n=1 Tax=Rhodobacter sp. SGA-6-6 TaxID=2710882 RepID=UPI0013EA014D|nr:DUF4177 domain-containing protein [Rhodobacter sp. SGA-6-6]NGM45608.1 DUF4177 domain-containing protein [Rhodobacter sp. SGA-6-6]
MQRYEYKVVPAPRRGEKARGVKTTEERFALALTGLMNRMGAEGWDYVRADALPCDERVGLTGSKTTFQNMLVFRRALEAGTSLTLADVPVAAPLLAAPEVEPPLPPLRLGAAEAPVGPAPSLGPAKPDLAAE